MQSATSFAYNRVETISDHYDEVLANRLRRMRKKVNWTYSMFSTWPVLVSSSRRPIVVSSSPRLFSSRIDSFVSLKSNEAGYKCERWTGGYALSAADHRTR